MIWAMARNRVIGRDGDLPWHIPEDLRHFKRATKGCPIVMGRKTWESLPGALPGRRNLVVSRQTGYAAEGAEVLPSLRAALDAARAGAEERLFIVGGAGIYAEALEFADELWVTFVDAEVEGNVEFPTEVDFETWSLNDEQTFEAGGEFGNEFAGRFARYSRR